MVQPQLIVSQFLPLEEAVVDGDPDRRALAVQPAAVVVARELVGLHGEPKDYTEIR